MRPIRIIAINTFREIIRDRIVYGLIVFALLLIGLSLALGQLSVAEHARMTANFGFFGIQMSASILAIFVGSTLVAREIEKQTVLTLLARPLTRAQFIVGKFAGLSLVVASTIFGLACILGLMLFIMDLDVQIGVSFFVALLGVLIEALLLISMALFFGSFARPMMTVVFTVAFFLIGHWVNTLNFFVEKSDSDSFKLIAGGIGKVVPNLEKFNWRSAPIYNLDVPAGEILGSVGYAFGWILLLLLSTAIIFRRRDFV